MHTFLYPFVITFSHKGVLVFLLYVFAASSMLEQNRFATDELGYQQPLEENQSQTNYNWNLNFCSPNIDIVDRHPAETKSMNVNRYKCTTCNVTFLDLHYLKWHVHQTDCIYYCTECCQHFDTKQNAISHDDVHRTEQILSQVIYQCAECYGEFPDRKLLQDHQVTCEVKSSESLFSSTDSYVPQVQNSTSNITNHQNIAIGKTNKTSKEKPFPCKLCGKTFAQSGALNCHLRIHTGERPYVCKECGKRFRQQSNLDFHRKIHTGEKPFPCKTCGKLFRQISNLNCHVKIHTGEMPYRCEECGKRFRQLANLNSHLKIHS